MKIRKVIVSLITVTLVLGLAISTHAAFFDLGEGMIYDDVLNITWLADANYAQTSGHDADGLMTWDQANTWVTNLYHGGTSGWRWPTFNPANARPYTATHGNEIGSLLSALTNGGFNLHLPDYTMADISPFYNLPHLLNSENSEIYWTGLACTREDGSPGVWDYFMG